MNNLPEQRPRIRSTGPSNAKIAIVGEAPGKDEEKIGIPFVGAAGQELNRILADAGISRRECYLTNVFLERPEGNDIKNYLVPKREVSHSLAPVQAGKYLRDELLPELERLRSELRAVQPNITVALGNTALWALTNTSAISKMRGTIVWDEKLGKILPTYHPAAVLRQWQYRVITVADLLKARREAAFPELKRPERNLILEPSFDEVLKWIDECEQHPVLSYDIETKHGTITCFGFAWSPEWALTIPLVDRRNSGYSYWSREQETEILRRARALLVNPDKTIICQNGLYDVQWTWRLLGIPIIGFSEDTMLLHHAMYPEMEKSLGFLASLYCNEVSWKLLKPRGEFTTKRDE